MTSDQQPDDDILISARDSLVPDLGLSPEILDAERARQQAVIDEIACLGRDLTDPSLCVCGAPHGVHISPSDALKPACPQAARIDRLAYLISGLSRQVNVAADRELLKSIVRPFTDAGNAERLVRLHGANLRYVDEWKKWLAWDGRCWAELTKHQVDDWVLDTMRAIRTEPDGLAVRHAERSESGIRRREAEASARHMVLEKPEDFNADPWLIACENGTVDLRTGQLREHRRSDLITRLVPIRYDPEARHERWERFLDEVFPDAEVRDFVLRCAGYSLTGDVREDAVFVCWGQGENGKSTWFNSIRHAAGPHGKVVDSDLLLAKRQPKHQENIADLTGLRLVTTIETQKGKAFDERVLKELSGGEPMSARHLYGHRFQFKNTAKLWLGVNQPPTVQGTDHAIWRRLFLIPFTVQFGSEGCPPEEKGLRDNLPVMAQEAILASLVRGCQDWQRQGLNPPDAVLAATQAYRKDMDIFEQFLTERCVTDDPNGKIGSAVLYDAFRPWADRQGRVPVPSQKEFTKVLLERGYVKKDERQGAVWYGLGLVGHPVI